MKTLELILADARANIIYLIKEAKGVPNTRLLDKVLRNAIEEAFDSKLEAEMKAQDEWWKSHGYGEEYDQQDEGRMEPDPIPQPEAHYDRMLDLNEE